MCGVDWRHGNSIAMEWVTRKICCITFTKRNKRKKKPKKSEQETQREYMRKMYWCESVADTKSQKCLLLKSNRWDFAGESYKNSFRMWCNISSHTCTNTLAQLWFFMGFLFDFHTVFHLFSIFCNSIHLQYVRHQNSSVKKRRDKEKKINVVLFPLFCFVFVIQPFQVPNANSERRTTKASNGVEKKNLDKSFGSWCASVIHSSR